jgi:hypothetical protein
MSVICRVVSMFAVLMILDMGLADDPSLMHFSNTMTIKLGDGQFNNSNDNGGNSYNCLNLYLKIDGELAPKRFQPTFQCKYDRTAEYMTMFQFAHKELEIKCENSDIITLSLWDDDTWGNADDKVFEVKLYCSPGSNNRNFQIQSHQCDRQCSTADWALNWQVLEPVVFQADPSLMKMARDSLMHLKHAVDKHGLKIMEK